MTDLSRDARSLVARARVHEGPSARDRARVRASLEPAWSAYEDAVPSAASSGFSAFVRRWPIGKMLVFLVVAAGLTPGKDRAATRAFEVPAAPDSASAHAPREPNPAAVSEPQPQSQPQPGTATPQPAAAAPVARARASGQASSPARASRRRGPAREQPELSEALTASAPSTTTAPSTEPTESHELPASQANSAASATREATLGSRGAADPSRASRARGHATLVTPRKQTAPVQSGSDFKPQAIDDELAWIGAAQEALQNHKPSRALRLVQEHGFRFPDGALMQERLVVHTLALCALERFTAARRILAVLEERAPDAPIVARVRSTCGL
jgi:hypothetical protein